MEKRLDTSEQESQLTAPASQWQIKGWVFWFIAALFYAYEFLHRVVPSILTSELRDAFSVNEHQLGTIGAMYFYAYAAFQLPAGILIDKFGTKRLLVIASAVLTLGSFLFSTTSSSLVAQMSRFMIGAGSAFAFVGCLKIGSQWLALSSFPLVVGLTNLCGTLGALSGGLPLSLLVQHVGWREALMQVSFAGLLITLLLWLFLQEKENKESYSPSSNTSATHHNLLAGLLLVLKNPQSWIIAFYGALLVTPIVALPELWGVEFLKIAYDIPATQASSITHTIFIGTAIGGPLIGWISSNLQDKTHFMMLATVGAFILLSTFIYWIQIPFASLYVILFSYGVLTANMLLCFTLITKQHPPWAQGTAIGFANMIIMLSGGFAQHGIGWILNTLRNQHQGLFLIEDYHIALSILPLCLIMAIFIIFFIQEPTD